MRRDELMRCDIVNIDEIVRRCEQWPDYKMCQIVRMLLLVDNEVMRDS